MDDRDQSPRLVDRDLALKLPQQVSVRLEEWQTVNGVSLTLDQWLTDGNTRALVAVVLAQGEGVPPTKLILKVCPPEPLTSREPKLHSEALIHSSEAFSSRHLVTQPFHPIECQDKWRILFQAIAGNSLRRVRPLSAILHHAELPRIVEHIIKVLLGEWNESYSASSLTPYESLKLDLGSKVHRNGSLAGFARDQGVIDQAWVRFSDQPASIMPNAVAWALAPTFWPAQAKSSFVLLGHTHGDLHPGNILLDIDPTPRADGFRLIDLSAYSATGSIAKDATDLCLAIISEYVTDIRSERQDLMTLATSQSRSVPLELVGLSEIVESRQKAFREWRQTNASSLEDDWESQTLLSLVSGSLNLVGRKSLAISKRMWFYQLSCAALKIYLTRQQCFLPPSDPGIVQLLGPRTPRDVEEAVNRLLEYCDRFGGSRILIGVLGPDIESSTLARIGDLPWTALMSFDAKLDKVGPLAVADTESTRLHRLVTVDQRAEYSRTSTVWFALGGLADLKDTLTTGFREWRRAYKKTLEGNLEALARYSSQPVTIVVFGTPDDRVRTIVEKIDDRFAARARFVLVNESANNLSELLDVHLEVDPASVVAELPLNTTTQKSISTLPGHDGPVVLSPNDADWIRELADLVDSSTGETAGDVDDIGRGFLQGRLVTWFELGLGHDVVPSIAAELLSRIRDELAGRDTRRVSLQHYPGSGGTTLARRIAWELHKKAPTLYCSGIHDELGLALRVSRLSQLTRLSVLVVLEQTSESVTDRFYNRLRSDSVSAVVLVVSRRVEPPKVAGPRSFYLGPATTRVAVHALAQRYGEYAPQRIDDLNAIRPNEPTAVPFHFGLIAFGKDYRGIEDYVRRSIESCTDSEQELLKLIALSYRYAGMSVASDLFSNILSIPANGTMPSKRHLSESAQALLVEDEPGFWRTSHWLIATEILRQLLPPVGRQSDWPIWLSGVARGFISECRNVFGTEPPDDIRDVLEHLFIVRGNREMLGGERPQSFSQLLQDIPSYGGRVEVLRDLSKTFPRQAHYWAHLGRLLSFNNDIEGALEAANRSLILDEHDSVLYHIRGMIYRTQLRGMADARRSTDEASFQRVTDLALADFAEAAQLDDDSEYPHVASAQVAISAIKYGRERSGCDTFAEFLALPGSAFYNTLLSRAEAALAAISEITGPDEYSARAEDAAVSLREIYDDYSALLQGWRNLLDRQDVVKAPIRSRIVSVYFRRAGGWAQLRQSDRQRVLSLLEDNLRDDPSDPTTLRDWLRVSRTDNASVERASELVSYWATRSRTRDALFYDYVLTALMAVNHREAAWHGVRSRIERCRDRAKVFGNRKFSYEWLGYGDNLNALIHYTDLPSWWPRDRAEEVPSVLRRIRARVISIDSPQAGTLRLEAGGIDAFFVPTRAGLIRGRHENAKVDAVIGFSYDGLRAWAVRQVVD